ncbi:MAG: hypothetical protein UX31_C0012G0020 [Candidatus Nomurabacteria bacterium GW2011_GWA1_46_11]|uniref:Uncharacterized protein n=1 Tax=Candidatus Nomurabacteria bacterium GW2011_GWA1_46_11 TaxID=1618732 RepID=A0A0G1NMI0_9BACT|nr:MAG: hypothetical protein UW73_C0009G0058 [Microgenomates group bacterium GW2011_GWB1_44_8]KKU21784.1 MAG: hypothetical protein UX31_C0012G0020 [Candidatus Nomurabacteria bacterium GW2011_GWA1_46_11]
MERFDENTKNGWQFTPLGNFSEGGGTYKLKVETVVGAGGGWWSQVHHFYPTDEVKLATKGEMVAVVSFKMSEAGDMEAMVIGREILGRLNEQYYGSAGGEVWDQLLAAVDRVRVEVYDPTVTFGVPIKTEAQEANEKVIKIEQLCIVTGVLWKGIWYAVGWGGGGLWMCREGEIGPLLSRQKESEIAKADLRWGGSGQARDNDLMLLGNKRFFDLVGKGVVKAALSGGSAEEAAGVLSPLVLGKNKGEGMAAALVVVEKLPNLQPVTEMMAESRVEQSLASGGQAGVGLKDRLRNLKNKFPKWNLWALNRRKWGWAGKDLYIRTYHPPGIGRRGTMAVGVFLLVLILGSIIVGVRIQKDRETAAGPVAQVSQRIVQAKELANISPERAREVLNEGVIIAGSIKETKKREELLGEIQELVDQLSGINRVTPVTFMDLKLVRDGIVLRDSYFDNKIWWGLDTGGQRLIKMDVASKRTEVVASKDQLGSPAALSSSADLAYVVSDKGIVEVDTKSGKARVVVASDKEWGRIVDMENFGGSLYLLDADKSAIWRYPPVEGGVGGKQRWLKSDTKADLANAAGMSIDGSIWIAMKGGSVLKFTQGVAEPFAISGIDEPVESLAGIYTTVDVGNLYLLDSGRGRVVVVSKKGEYIRQYIASEFRRASSLVVDGSRESAVWVSVEDKVLEVRMNSL